MSRESLSGGKRGADLFRDIAGLYNAELTVFHDHDPFAEACVSAQSHRHSLADCLDQAGGIEERPVFRRFYRRFGLHGWFKTGFNV
jgi:hypothetical protein